MIKKILVSQPQPSSEKSPYFNIAQKYGVELVFRPFIKVEGVSAKDFRKEKVNILDYTAIVFTSRTAVDHFFRLAKEQRTTIPEDMKYFFISQQVSLYVQQYIQYRKRKIFFGKSGLLSDLIEVMLKHKKEKFFIPQSDVHRKDLSTLLDSKGLDHTDCVMYRTVSATLDKSQPFDYDMIVFFTPSGAKSLVDNYPGYEQGDTVFACFGDGTARKLEDLGFRVDIKVAQGQGQSMASTIEEYLKAQKA